MVLIGLMIVGGHDLLPVDAPVYKESLFLRAVRPNFGSPAVRVFRLRSRWRAGCANVIQQANRRLLADRAVRALLVVVLAPILQFFLRVRKAQEPVSVQTFRPEATVERFDKRIVGRLAWPREVERHAALVGP